LSGLQGDLLTLLQQSGARLHALLVRLTLREDVAEDLMQDLFVRLANSDGFRGARKAEAYAYTVAIRLAFDWRRSRRAKHASQLLDEPGFDDSFEQRLEDAEQIEEVLRTMEQLSANDCEILIARYLGQESYEAIAEKRATTAHQARSQCHKAMTRLRKLLDVEPRRSNKESPHADA